jgi:SAM-dependent methyltransferase
MKLIKGKTIVYDSDEEFYSRQVLGARPHDNNRIVKTHIAEAIRFLMLGGKLALTEPPAERTDPNFSADTKFLDVGCRDGWSLTYLKKGCPNGFTIFPPKKRFSNTCGLELSRETVKYARAKGRNVIEGDIRNLVIGENVFDVVFTRHCLEHLDRPLDALRNIARMLKPGGTLLVIVPREDQDLNPEKSLHSHQFRNDNELADLIAAAGLTVVDGFRRNKYSYHKRKYWYKLSARLRWTSPELWVLAIKS